jgi:hypothetical protein
MGYTLLHPYGQQATMPMQHIDGRGHHALGAALGGAAATLAPMQPYAQYHFPSPQYTAAVAAARHASQMQAIAVQRSMSAQMQMQMPPHVMMGEFRCCSMLLHSQRRRRLTEWMEDTQPLRSAIDQLDVGLILPNPLHIHQGLTH